MEEIEGLNEKLLRGEISTEDAVKEVQAKVGRPGWSLGDKADRRAQYKKARLTRKKILKDRIPFITPSFRPGFYLAQGLVVVGAESGKSKSTTCANMLAGFLKHTTNKQAVVITNEEEPDAVLERTACVIQELDYLKFHNGLLTPSEDMRILDTIDEMLDRVEILSENEKWNMQYYEDVVSVLESSVDQNVGIVFVDYLQTITMSREDEGAEAFKISKKLGFFLKDFGKRNGIPVVTFVQLSPETGFSPTMAARVQNDKTFYNHGFVCVEIVPDFKTRTTEFIIHKDRFCGQSGQRVKMEFDGGRHVMGGL